MFEGGPGVFQAVPRVYQEYFMESQGHFRGTQACFKRSKEVPREFHRFFEALQGISGAF